MDTHEENDPDDGAPWRAVFKSRLVGASSLVFVFVVVVVFSKGRKVSRHNETLYNACAFSREKNARVVEREFRGDATVFGK